MWPGIAAVDAEVSVTGFSPAQTARPCKSPIGMWVGEWGGGGGDVVCAHISSSDNMVSATLLIYVMSD